MDNREAPPTPDGAWSQDSYMEMLDRLNSLRSLVCDLLKTNQELRYALVEAGACGQHSQWAQPKQADESSSPRMAK